MRRSSLALITACLLTANLLQVRLAQAEDAAADGPLWTGNDVEVQVMVEYISKFLGKRFVFDPVKLRGKKIAIQSSTRIPRKAVYKIFQSIMQMHGFTLIEYDDYVRIEQTATARLQQTGVFSTEEAKKFAGEDRMITRVFTFEHINSKSAGLVIEKLINPKAETLESFGEANLLVVTGFARNLERIAKLIESMDRAGPETVMRHIEFKHARVDDVVRELKPLIISMASRRMRLGDRGKSIPAPQMVALSRNNSMVINALPDEIKQLEETIGKLDVPSPIVKIEFVKVKHASAEGVSRQLQSFVRTFNLLRSRPGPKRNLAPPSILADKRTNGLVITATEDELVEIKEMIEKLDVEVSGLEPRIRVFPVRNADAAELAGVMEQILKPSGKITGAAPKKAASAKPQAGRTTTPGTAAARSIVATEEEEIEIVAQRGSIVVKASAATLESVENLLKELDVRKPKVLIEAAIVELTVNREFNLGVELALVDQPGSNARAFGATSVGVTQLLDTDNDGIPDARIPIPGPGLIAGIFKDQIGNIPFILKALDSKAKVRVLAAPMIVADDNEEATFRSSDQFPVATFTSTQSTTDVTTFGGFQEAKIELSIKPTINEKDGYLRLEIKQIVEAFQGNAVSANLPPRKVSREITAVVTVPDNRIVVIGGLNNELVERTVRGVPILQKIPFLGVLFRGKENKDVQTRLYAFVHPRILKDLTFEDYQRLSEQRQKEIEEFIKEQESSKKNSKKKRKAKPDSKTEKP